MLLGMTFEIWAAEDLEVAVLCLGGFVVSVFVLGWPGAEGYCFFFLWCSTFLWLLLGELFSERTSKLWSRESLA